ncbi:hypothetical protein AXY_02070 [Amphibacillus xylanus NBRC 15112]|uniref:Uncharacterized protein n=1 Tax=Amphibacillus xylanus (strain ATCC 51415 / DSM 6626 / JCM 7361 / LMG 17667 / NBRC 15112 / Ep01) TaxID=698758 RepID=K0IV89_AMPXN|nr:hypothetical protein AXY_02070 [Amphibacillus xylanus NBRC 15112]
MIGVADNIDMAKKLSEFHCNVCATELSTEQIKVENKYDIDVAYVDCPECDNRFNMMFDNRNTVRIKNKIKKVKEIEHYLQLQLYREMMMVEDDYYKQSYNDLSDAEKKRIGKYQPSIDKQKLKEYNRAIKDKKYTAQDLLRLL